MQARSAPVLRMLHEARAHGITQDITEDREEMRVLLNRKTFEPALPHRPMAPVMPMVASDVAGHPPLYKRTEGGCGGRLYDQMKMIGHQAEAENLDGMSSFRRAEQIENGRIVAVLVKDRGAAVATVQDMIGVPGDLTTRSTRHEGKTLGVDKTERQEKSSPSHFLVQ